ncbi:uncharacterized protein LOC133720442 [Rosa rugosa]|uniref:uncharacterized protein LOC133720442 n=1 Tax=Rosa rugosa TaxID=74645 RepID=UPI002B40BF20|nr:uncharacterized protein LOC133720442 [Rosa rugosa]
MSPAAADARSPITSKPSGNPQNPKPSSEETPSSNPFNFNAVGSDGPSCPNVPSRSARPRPRLAKQRRKQQANAGSRTGPAETAGPEVNPFCSVSGGGGAATSVFNQFSFPSGGVGFVFGATLSGVDERAQVNSGDGREFGEVESVSAKQDDPPGPSSCGERRECDTDQSGKEIFECDQNHSAPNLSAENGESAECVEKLGDFGCAAEVGQSEYCENEGKSGNDSSGIGFVFGSGWFNSSSDLNSGKNMEKVVDEVGRKMRVESDTEFEKVKVNSFEFHSEERWSSDKVHDEGIFVFGSSGKKGSSLTDSKVANCQDEVKSSDEGDCKSNSNSRNDNLSSDFSSKCNLVSETSEVTCGDNHKSTDHVVFGSESNTAGTTSGISSSTEFTFQAGLGDSVDAGQFPECQINKPNAAAGPCSFSSIGLGIQLNGCVSEAASAGGVKGKDESSFTSSPDGFGVCFEDFNTPLRFPACLKENLFPEINKSNISMKGRSVRDKRSRKTRGKLKKPSLSKQWPAQDNVPKESSSQETPVSPGCGSPMDFSPYEETTVANPHSRESSTVSNDTFHLVSNTAPCGSDATVPIGPNGDEGEFAAKGDQIYGKATDENSRYHGERIFVDNCSSKGSGSGAETPCFSSNGISHAGKDSEDVRADNGVNLESQEQDCGTPCFASGLENMERKTFTFVASSSAEGSPIVARRLLRRAKNKKKVGSNTFVITPSPNVQFGGSDQFTPHSSTPLSFDAVGKSEPHEQVPKVHIPSTEATHETCEKWRIRGNKAYRNKDFSKAEDFYTQGIVSVPSSERSGSCLKPLLLCYSNRAATRMYMGRIREALGDCMMATALDPNFLKVQMRAANFHLLLGEVENAQRYFNNCLESGTGVCLDRRIVIDSADGIQKAQKVAEYTNRSAKLLEQRTTDAALSALEIVSEALSISEYSEKLLEMKAEALCLLRRYEEAIQLCEQSMYFAEKNFSSLNSVVNMDTAGCEDHPYARLWRWFFISKSYFHLGRFQAALDLLEKLEQVGSIKDRYASKNLESSISLAVTIRELLSHKDAGNEAFRSGRYTEAVEHYTVALSRNIGSRPFSSICLCNRAAAHQALGQITDAIADCSLAIALDGHYVKAVSRRATLHEMIRDYGQAASDLQRLISVLENQSGDKAKEPTSQGSSNGRTQELRNSYRRMPLMEEEAKKGIPLNFYLILGIKSSDTSSDIKKAYRKAALKHHPDKAGQFLARSESGDEGQLWKEISLEVHKDADRLFKMIGEAYAVLSDPNKRSEYDLEEDIRKSAKESKERGVYRKSSDFQSPRRSSYRKPDFYSSPFERSSYCRNSREGWKTYGDSYSRW